ncbi:MAG TPA: glycosyltransferase family 2 protein [Solirubrobacterales bacterium]|nr:glycosyltransferase family 2 protein [Solirubrobacterales bacterium]
MGPEPKPREETRLAAIVAARNEADRVGETVGALRATFPGARVWVADDASTDGTAEAAMLAGAEVVRRGRSHGKGGNVTAAAEAALSVEPPPRIVLLCDGDLGACAARLAPLVDAVERDRCDLAVASFRRRLGGGFGIALGFARWAIEHLCGLETRAPISGQRALRVEALRSALPFADGYGMEIGMTVDAVRAGYRLHELELDLEHRTTGRDLSGFLHRAAQLRDFGRVFLAKSRRRRSLARDEPR